MIQVRSGIVFMAGMILFISGCTTCRTSSCQPACSGNVNINQLDSGNVNTGSGRRCSPPMWYPSIGHYVPFVDDFLTSWSARSCAVSSLKHQNGGRHLNSDDFRNGYVQAFEDVSLGSQGVMPAVAPPKYWKGHNRSVPGHRRADDWFAGYRSGLSDSSYKQVPERTNVPVSYESGMRNNNRSTGNYY